MAKGRLVASVVSQELLEELVLPRCESADESEYLAIRFGHVCESVPSEKTLSYQGSENRRLKRAPPLFDNFTVTTSTIEQFTHKNNDAKHEN